MLLLPARSQRRCSVLQWNPDVATQLVVASEDDRTPTLQMWDLRNSMSPVKEFVGHVKVRIQQMVLKGPEGPQHPANGPEVVGCGFNASTVCGVCGGVQCTSWCRCLWDGLLDEGSVLHGARI